MLILPPITSRLLCVVCTVFVWPVMLAPSVRAEYSQEHSEAQTLSVKLDIDYSSRYIFRGFQEANGTIATGIEVSANGVFVGLRHFAPVENVNSIATQTHFFAGFKWRMRDKLNAVIGARLLDNDNDGADRTEIFAALNFDHWTHPEARLYYDFDLESWTGEAALSHSWLIAPQINLEAAATAGTIQAGGKDAQYFLTEAALNRAMGDHLHAYIKAGFGANTQKTYFDDIDDVIQGNEKKTGAWLGIGLKAQN
ncbi:MAG: hypothetical protein ACWA5L_04010 [bacterium]